MGNGFKELEQIRITNDDETRLRHLAAIEAEIQGSTRSWFGSRRMLVVFVGLVLLLPVAAFAAEDAVPGDLLYPFKRIVEPVMSILDSDLAAKHRIEELEQLIDDNAPADQIQDTYQEAEAAVVDVPELSDRLDALRAEIDADPTDEPSSDEPPTDREGVSGPRGDTSTTVSTAPSDRDSGGETDEGGSDQP